MADKTWVATDLELGPLKLTPYMVEDALHLHVERRYKFVDADGSLLNNIAGGRVIRDVVFADLPDNIRGAIIDIDAWTKYQALAQEDMDE